MLRTPACPELASDIPKAWPMSGLFAAPPTRRPSLPRSTRSVHAMARTLLGHEIRHVEDPALLTGEARFVADLVVDGLLDAVFVRSTLAHGVVRGIDADTARSMPGVVAVLTANDLDLPAQGESQLGPLARPLLAVDRVRFVGEPVAVVVAGSYTEALDAAEAVIVEIDPLPVALGAEGAAADDAPLLFPHAGTNIVGGRHHDEDVDFFAGADIVVSTRLEHQRIAPVPMEADGAVAVPEADGSFTLWASTQSVFGVREDVCTVLDLTPEQLRVPAPAIGGGFGAKGGTYVEQILTVAMARHLARPVRWIGTRSENLLGMTHGHAQVHRITVITTRDGRLDGLRVHGWADVGTYRFAAPSSR